MSRAIVAFSGSSALDASIQDMKAGGTGILGAPDAPVRLGNGGIFTLVTDRGDGTATVFAVGVYEGDRRVVRARIRRAKPVFHHAIFAGNSSGDPDYEMKFGGNGGHADDINGDVYSGGSIRVDGHADVAGTARARNDVTASNTARPTNASASHRARPPGLIHRAQASPSPTASRGISGTR